jgi:hypothetical protein
VSVPVQFACKPVVLPQDAFALMLLYVPAAGLVQLIAEEADQVKLPTAPALQLTVGGVIAVPAVPDEGTVPQLRVGAGALLLETGAELELLGVAAALTVSVPVQFAV